MVPLLGVGVCLFMMVFLPVDTWIRLIVWMIIGLDIYLVYGAKHSVLGKDSVTRSGLRTANWVGFVMCVLLLIAGYIHQYVVGFDADRTLLYLALIFGAVHIVIYLRNIARHKQ